MQTYELFGFVIASDLAFPELTAATAGDAMCVVRLTDRPFPQPPTTCFLQTRLPNGDPWLSCAKCDSGYFLTFNDLATFRVSARGDRVDCHVERHVPAHTVRHLFLDAVFPLILNLRGHHAVHATAVCGPIGCCAFVGDAGLGKSTLAAAFLRRGWMLVCDDCLRIDAGHEGMLAVPGYAGLRLWPDATAALFDEIDGSPPAMHDNSKRRVSAGVKLPAHAVPLRCLYILVGASGGREASIRIEASAPRDAFIDLVRHAFRLDLGDGTMLARQFRFLERIVQDTPIRRLTYSREFVHLPAVTDAIVCDLEEHQPNPGRGVMSRTR